jgi:putative transposase
MKRKRFSVEQIVAVLKQAEIRVTGCGTDSASGDHGADLVSLEEAKGLETNQVLQFKQLRDENGRLKRLVVEPTWDRVMLKDLLAKKL